MELEGGVIPLAHRGVGGVPVVEPLAVLLFLQQVMLLLEGVMPVETPPILLMRARIVMPEAYQIKFIHAYLLTPFHRI